MFYTEIGSAIPEVSHKRIEAPSRSVYFNHIHNHCEMLLFISGKAEYNIDGQIFRPEPYDLLFVPAATYHYLIPTATEPYENYVIGLDPALVEKAHYDRLFLPPRMLHIRQDPELMGFFARLDRYHSRYRQEDFVRCARALIRELVVWCSYRAEELAVNPGGAVSHAEAIARYITEHLEEPLDADRIARHFMLSKSYVQNLFSRDMHIGLKQYIMQKKIYAAHGALAAGESPNRVCERYGFGDYSSFYRLYKKTFAASPGRDRP